jgi:ATP-binding cassette, subfamily F, member 3
LIQFIGIQHQFGSNLLFDNFSWHIKPNQKIGLVGPNGIGKSTLFHFATDALTPDGGKVVKSKGTIISLFHQIPNFDFKKSCLDTLIFSHKYYVEYYNQKILLDKLFDEIHVNSEEYNNLLLKQSNLEDYATENDIHKIENQAQKILNGLGFSSSDFHKQVGNFSPGFQHRIGLAIALLNPHNLLLLDEPTNHLDDETKNWLIDYLNETSNSFILVTHDPEFLRQTTDTIVEISKNEAIEFRGTLEEFLEEKNEIHEKLKNKFLKEEAYLNKRLDWINRFRAQATKAKQVQSRIKSLDKRERIDNPDKIYWNQLPDYEFQYISSGKLSLKIENCNFSYKDKAILENVNLEVSNGDKIALIGENGAGKSTLIKCLIGLLKFDSGNIQMGPKTQIGYFSQTHREELDESLSIIDLMKNKFSDSSEVSLRNILGHFSFSGDSVFKKVGSLSGGEQSRLRIAILVMTPTNTLFFDEPTNHLDLVTRNGLRKALGSYPGSVIIISHDPEFLNGLCTSTYEVNERKLIRWNCSFEEYLLIKKDSKHKIDKNKDEKKNDYQARNQEKNKIKKKQKELSDLEETISKLEDEIKLFEQKLIDSNFLSSKDYSSEYNKFTDNKNKLEELTIKWEILVEEIG